MKMERKMLKLTMVVLVGCASFMVAQSSPPQRTHPKPSGATVQAAPEARAAQERSDREHRLGSELAEASREAAGEGENAAFKYSPSVKWLAAHTGLNVVQAYWVFFIINFAVVAVAIAAIVKAK